jgi:hypothetical protein
MMFFYLTLGCLLVIISSLLLRKASRTSRWLSLIVFVIAVLCFIGVYGNIGGFFVAIPTWLLINLLVAFLLGKSAK